MRLLSIRAQNFRTLEDATVEFSRDYCSLSGKNNAGKSCVIRLVINLLEQRHDRPWATEEYAIDYGDDHTQWAKADSPIIVAWRLQISRTDDSALIAFAEKLTERELPEPESVFEITLEQKPGDEKHYAVTINGDETSVQAAREIVAKLKTSDCLFLHNSTTQREGVYYFGRGRGRACYEIFLSPEEQKMLSEAGKTVQRRTRKLAKEHRDQLNEMLGKLVDRYDVEFAPLEGLSTRQMPLRINLKDKDVEVPLNDWGSGTQNRTYVLMSILQANRIKNRETSGENITPIVIIEEPESFLHPSAQAEFGRLLQDLATELEIQIIASTHSPYMLNQASPESNILLRRNVLRGRLKETEIVPTAGDSWMEPFADHLGVIPPEFDAWRGLFATVQPRVLLVEGEADKEYFEFLKESLGQEFGLPSDVEIVPYGGKDALKNTALVKFVLGKFQHTYITFDLDAAQEISRALARLGLKDKLHFCAIGIAKPGKDSIEGMLPDRVISRVAAENSDLVMQLGSTKSDERRSAKRGLKAKYLAAFKADGPYDDREVQHFLTIGKLLKKAFA